MKPGRIAKTGVFPHRHVAEIVIIALGLVLLGLMLLAR